MKSLLLLLLVAVVLLVPLCNAHGGVEHEMEEGSGGSIVEHDTEGTIVANITPDEHFPLKKPYEFKGDFCPSAEEEEGSPENEMTKCIPRDRRCRRLLIDDLVSTQEAEDIRTMFDSILTHYSKEVDGPAKLVDLNKGIISYMNSFADLHKLVAMQVGNVQKWIKQQKDNEVKIIGEEAIQGASSDSSTAAATDSSSSFPDGEVKKQQQMAEAVERRAKFTDRAKQALKQILGPLKQLDTYHEVVSRIHKAVTLYYLTDPDEFTSENDSDAFYETHKHVFWVAEPTFFSRLEGGKKPKSPNDEYWHEHVDTDQYGTFAVTSLLYLNTQSRDPEYSGPQAGAEGADPIRAGFEGGSFIFGSPYNATVHPRTARFSAFTSSSENPHRVEQVVQGVRYALTSAFTCAHEHAYSHPITDSALEEEGRVVSNDGGGGATEQEGGMSIPTAFLSNLKGLLVAVKGDDDLGAFFDE